MNQGKQPKLPSTMSGGLNHLIYRVVHHLRRLALGFNLRIAEARNFPEADRRTEEEALHLRASKRPHVLHLLFGLNTFRGRGHLKALCETSDCPHDSRRLLAFSQTFDERTVDLDLFKREAAQITQRGIPGAEVVHRNVHAEVPQAMEGRDCHLGVLHQHRFGDLELQAARRETRNRDGIGDSRQEGVDKNALKDVADSTGGRAFFPKKEDDLKAAFAEIERELRSQYLVAYSSTNRKHDGTFRRMTIEIMLSGPTAKPLVLPSSARCQKIRRGYRRRSR